MPASKRSLWVGLGAVVVAGAIAAVMAMRGGNGPADGSADASIGAGGAGVAITEVASAGDSRAKPGPGGSAGSAGEQASQLVDAGRSEAAAGHYVQALALYQRAYALDPAPSTLFELGLMEHLTGRCRDARRTTQRVVAAAPGGALAEKAQELLDRIGRCD